MQPPDRIGSYRVERLLGVGSFATVWLGYDESLDARVAIKVLAENWSHDLRVRERFRDEARLLWRLDHDRLVRVHTVGELPDGRPYAVLAWADAGSLAERLKLGPLPVETALDLLREIAAGVAVLHARDIVHRDLTPGNVLFRTRPDGTEQVLIADLGLAKALAAASGLTARAGTPGYMAPEQDDPLSVVDARADVYGLGRLGAELLTDQAPAPVAAILRRASAADPADRYPDAAAFAVALTSAARNSAMPASAAPASAGPDGEAADSAAPEIAAPLEIGIPTARNDAGAGTRTRRRGRRVAALAGLGAAVMAAAAVGWFWPSEQINPGGSTGTDNTGRLSVSLPEGWRAAGSGWAGEYEPDGALAPALVISPDPGRWADDPAVPGAFVGVTTGRAAEDPAGFVAGRPPGACTATGTRSSTQAGIEWVITGYADCADGRPELAVAAGHAPDGGGLVFVQVAPPAGSPPGFVDELLAGIRLG